MCESCLYAERDYAIPGPAGRATRSHLPRDSALPDRVLWYRPAPRVWSIGEHLDHSRVVNRFLRRLMIVYYPLGSIIARLVRHRPYKADIDYLRVNLRNYPKSGGWIFPPKRTPRRPVSVGFLREALRAEHAAYRRFYSTHDEQVLGHVVLADPANRRHQLCAVAADTGVSRRPPLRKGACSDQGPGVWPRAAAVGG